MPQLWAGIDAGKHHHHVFVIDETGTRRFSRRIPNDEETILEVLAKVNALAEGAPVTWATDLTDGGARLLISVLAAHEQNLLYIPGRTLYHAAKAYTGEGKTDAKDARIIADQARMRRDLKPVSFDDEVAAELRMLTGYRADLVADRTRVINRLRATLLEYFPGLERAFDYARSKAGLLLLTGYQTPAAIREAGEEALTDWLRTRGARAPGKVAGTAIEAANAQHTTVTGQAAGAAIVARLAEEILRLDSDITGIEAQITQKFQDYADAEILLSMPGFGPLLAAEFIAHSGGNPAEVFTSADRLASAAGLAPAPRDSGRISGNHHRPRRYNRRLLRTCYLAAQIAVRCCAVSQAFYQRKRLKGKNHKQAVLALARRRINVIWAMLRDKTEFHTGSVPAPATA
ncbi:IS110 family transposase [Nesterenkonia alkaliphila]|uniref:IS110 family transposase n=1 Tax=Nesterenkonia alkaliphila TaxID=1463631 RepID=A0A7K1UG90_9MICC|nr:IS110 family transposase [Nesterenkonia alkaliphila]MVT25483.1 IS110 family transposase [Nesterenkonia alkaliphila]GFZ96542.1 IS110 family transposase [Nesterenkonia alkaliphila]